MPEGGRDDIWGVGDDNGAAGFDATWADVTIGAEALARRIAFYEGYGFLEPGHDERLAIYRLWPALVHMRPGYRPMVERLLQATGT